MASAISHVVAAGAISAWFYHRNAPLRIWILGVAAAVLPDVDVLGFRAGIPYDHVLGHRGVTHSLAFAVVVGLLSARLVTAAAAGLTPRRVAAYFALATASHGILDAFTNGGLGVAFFAPIVNHRFFFPVRPIEVSPLSIHRFLEVRGFDVLRSEITWVWIPSLFVATAAYWYRRGHIEAPRDAA